MCRKEVFVFDMKLIYNIYNYEKIFFFRRSLLLSRIPSVRVQRGKHAVLDGVRGLEVRAAESADCRGKGAAHLRRLHIHIESERGLVGLARSRDHQPQHG